MEIAKDNENNEIVNNSSPQEEFIYSELQFKNKLIELESRADGETNKKDLILTNLNELDIVFSRSVINSVKEFNMFGLNNVAKEVLIPNLWGIVNTARARDGFERKAQITNITDEKATITQKGQGANWIDKIRGRGK